MKTFRPKLSILPASQRKIWTELRPVGAGFVLYGGTALSLQLGHRQSEDFDFFSPLPLTPDELERKWPFLEGGERLQSAANTLVALVDRQGPVKLSFFGGLKLNRVGDPSMADDNGLLVASLEDLAATKARVVQGRAQAKDYLDIEALIRAGISLEKMLAFAATVYGPQFNPLITLKALSYFEDGDLPSLPKETRDALRECAGNIREIPPAPEPRGSLLPAENFK